MLHFLLVLVITIAVLVLLIVRFKVHPVMALFIAGLGAGLAYGYGTVKAISTFVTGFGNTLGGIGCTIIFGSIIAMSIQDTGAIKSMVNFFIKLFRGKCLELTVGLAGFIMSIPIFGDVTKVLTAPLAAVISKRKKMSMSTMSAWTTLATDLTHSMVPPTPGILAVTIAIGADVGMMVFWSTIVAVLTYFIVWLSMKKWVAKEWIPPREDFTKSVEEVTSDDYEHLLIKEPGLPPVFLAALPIILPVILIAGASFAGMNIAKDTPVLPADNPLRVFLSAVGERNIAMFIGAVICIITGFFMKDNILKNSKINTGEDNKNIGEILLNKWVGRALTIALLPLLITAMGGGFSAIIRAYPGIDALGKAISQTNFPSLLIPWGIAVIMMIAVGSRTTAGMTAAAIVLPMAGGLGLSPLALALLIGSGTMVGSHVSDSGFWVASQFFNLSTKQGFKYFTLIQTVGGVVSLILVSILIGTGLV
ncbi:MAG: GntP family permease [Spirochaetaceae bacterium]|jgi:GntP family gluconate:H+ symporter|nr:GntP family permease [Spirochaetaceae bacterium]